MCYLAHVCLVNDPGKRTRTGHFFQLHRQARLSNLQSVSLTETHLPADVFLFQTNGIRLEVLIGDFVEYAPAFLPSCIPWSSWSWCAYSNVRQTADLRTFPFLVPDLICLSGGIPTTFKMVPLFFNYACSSSAPFVHWLTIIQTRPVFVVALIDIYHTTWTIVLLPFSRLCDSGQHSASHQFASALADDRQRL